MRAESPPAFSCGLLYALDRVVADPDTARHGYCYGYQKPAHSELAGDTVSGRWNHREHSRSRNEGPGAEHRRHSPRGWHCGNTLLAPWNRGWRFEAMRGCGRVDRPGATGYGFGRHGYRGRRAGPDLGRLPWIVE